MSGGRRRQVRRLRGAEKFQKKITGKNDQKLYQTQRRGHGRAFSGEFRGWFPYLGDLKQMGFPKSEDPTFEVKLLTNWPRSEV